jgi:hypothetical protein
VNSLAIFSIRQIVSLDRFVTQPLLFSDDGGGVDEGSFWFSVDGLGKNEGSVWFSADGCIVDEGNVWFVAVSSAFEKVMKRTMIKNL